MEKDKKPEIPKAFTSGISTGMTLRDYFAGLAMQGIMVGDNPASHYPKTVSEWAYSIADEMLKQRL